MKLWGGRFETGPSEIFERFSGSLDFDRRLIDADIRGSQAFARALERAGILTAAEREKLLHQKPIRGLSINATIAHNADHSIGARGVDTSRVETGEPEHPDTTVGTPSDDELS